MILPDVNVLIYAHRKDLDSNQDYLSWLRQVENGDETFGMSTLVLSSFIRVVTNPRVFANPTPLDIALDFANQLITRPHCLIVAPGARHWRIFTELCRGAQTKGNLVADAYLAALAIESGCEWITTDRDFARFPGLRWRHPLEA